MLAAERHAKHAQEYQCERHRPEETVLYRTVSTHWSEFRKRLEGVGSLPKFVLRDVDEYLRCGILEHGFIRVQCTDCGFARLEALSCKRRGFCPSCLGRRMSDTAVCLTEHVIPTVQVRQWVCTLPWELRIRAGYDRELCALVLDTFVRELQRSYRWRAKREFGLSSVDDAFTGMVTVIQRFDSALRLNVHFHTLMLDGVYVKSDNGEGLRFLRLPRPSEDDVYEVAMRTAKKVQAKLAKRGRTSERESNGDEEREIEPALGACYDVAARAPKRQVVALTSDAIRDGLTKVGLVRGPPKRAPLGQLSLPFPKMRRTSHTSLFQPPPFAFLAWLPNTACCLAGTTMEHVDFAPRASLRIGVRTETRMCIRFLASEVTTITQYESFCVLNDWYVVC